jgi:DNA-binding MarR family transcriptional regulator
MSKRLPFDPIAEARRQWSTHWGRAATPAMAAVTSIMRAQQILMGRLNSALKPHGLTFPRYEALMILYLSRHGSMPLGKIGERLQVHPTSVTSLIDGLERTGYIRRVPHDEDRRATLAEITDAGRRTAEDATAELNRARFFTEPLRRAELDSISEILVRLRADEDGFKPVA